MNLAQLLVRREMKVLGNPVTGDGHSRAVGGGVVSQGLTS